MASDQPPEQKAEGVGSAVGGLPPRVVTVGCEKPPAPEAWFMAPYAPDLTQRMLNELSASLTPVIED
ncbi:Lipoprotein Rz1 precursor [compost metagenome]